MFWYVSTELDVDVPGPPRSVHRRDLVDDARDVRSPRARRGVRGAAADGGARPRGEPVALAGGAGLHVTTGIVGLLC